MVLIGYTITWGINWEFISEIGVHLANSHVSCFLSARNTLVHTGVHWGWGIGMGIGNGGIQ